VLVGSPNVGKSVIFNYLTGQYVTVSNYPGTTVDISRGYSKIKGKTYEVIDTPGIYSLMPITQEECVARKLLCQEKPDIVIHVIDAKNLRRMLNLTIQLMESGFPLIVVANLMDEAQKYSISLNLERLSEILNIPVIPMAAARGVGLELLKDVIGHYNPCPSNFALQFTLNIDKAVKAIASMLKGDYGVSQHMVALLLIQGDSMIYKLACRERSFSEIIKMVKNLTDNYQYNMEYTITLERQSIVNSICNEVLINKGICQQGFVEKLGQLAREPVTGIPILCVVLFLGVYQFVGRFGAGFLVEYLDSNIFNCYISPIVEKAVYQNVSWDWLKSMIIGKYGVFSLGFHYAFIIILPIVSTFFFMFAILEDSGYLPRLAMLVDHLFKKISLNGRAVIPFSLGLGCGTMAVMVTTQI
jgi:ferrous iron transport protein B